MKDEFQATFNLAALICGLILACFVIGSLTYGCTRPDESRPVDRELQAQRIIENNKMAGCVRSGGSWMPVRTPNGLYEMSCVTDRTLPLVSKMNKVEE